MDTDDSGVHFLVQTMMVTMEKEFPMLEASEGGQEVGETGKHECGCTRGGSLTTIQIQTQIPCLYDFALSLLPFKFTF